MSVKVHITYIQIINFLIILKYLIHVFNYNRYVEIYATFIVALAIEIES